MRFWDIFWTCVLCVLLRCCAATYVSPFRSNSNSNDNKVNGRGTNLMNKRKYGIFKSNSEIMHYLKLFGTDMMIWRCKNAIQPFWDWKPLPVLEIDCETIGIVRDIEWYHNKKKINTESEHYSQSIRPHMSQGKFFSSWLDFTLKIYNATTEDSGIYTFKTVSARGFGSQQTIYVDISAKKKKKRNRKKNKRKHKALNRRNSSRRDFERFYLFHKYHNSHRGSGKKDNVHTHGYKEVKTGKNTYYTI